MNSKLKWAAGIGLMIAAIAAFFPIRVFEAALSDQFSAQIRQNTGLTSHVAGGVAFSLLPRPRVRLEGVTIGSDAGSLLFETPLMKGDLRILPLIAGRFEIEALTLIGPKLIVATGGVTGDAAADTPLQIADLAKFGVMTIAGGQFSVQTEGEPPRLIFSKIDGVLDPSNLPAQVSFVGGAVWNGERGAVEALIGKPDQFIEGGMSPATVKIVSRIADVTLDGTLQGGAKWQFDGRVAGASANPRALMQKLQFNPALPGDLAKASLSGTLRMTRQALAISDASLSLDNNSFRGSLAVRSDGGRPLVSATLASPSLVYTAEQGVTLSPRTDGQWRRDPLSFDALALVDMDLRLSAQRARVGRVSLTSAGMAIMISDGKLDLSLGAAQAYGGRVKGQLLMTPIHNGHDLKGTLTFTNVDVGAFLRDVSRTPRITGTASGEVSMQSAGETVARHMETADGKIRLSVKNGELAGMDAEQALRRSEKRPLSVPTEVRLGSTSFQSADIIAGISHGVVVIDRGHVYGYGVGLDIGGAINLSDQNMRLDIGVSPARRPEAMASGGAGSILNFNLTGPWDHPNFILDTDSLIRRSEAAAALLGAQIKPPAPAAPLPAAISGPGSRRYPERLIEAAEAGRKLTCRAGEKNLLKHGESLFLEQSAGSVASQERKKFRSFRVFRDGGKRERIDDRRMRIRRERRDDPHAGFGGGVRGVDDTERRFATGDEVHRRAHIVGHGQMRRDLPPQSQLLQRCFGVSAGWNGVRSHRWKCGRRQRPASANLHSAPPIGGSNCWLRQEPVGSAKDRTGCRP